MNENTRRRTINSKGEIISKPYGISRWANPRTRACAHPDCTNPAIVLKPANSHATTDDPASASTAVVAKAHNCCCANH